MEILALFDGIKRTFAADTGDKQLVSQTFVIKLNRIKPIDEEAVKLALNCKNVYFFEEGTKNGGIAETFGCMLEERGFSGAYKATAITDSFVEHAPVSELYKKYSLDTDGIYNICTE